MLIAYLGILGRGLEIIKPKLPNTVYPPSIKKLNNRRKGKNVVGCSQRGLNSRPLDYETNALPNCAMEAREYFAKNSLDLLYIFLRMKKVF